MSDLGFHHRFVAGAPNGDGLTLLLLHGTGADESDLIPVGQALAPDAALLSPRGKVLENGMPRFFRRLAEGVFDLEDLKLRTDELAEFVIHAAQKYDLRTGRILAVGYSNGANIASSLMLTHPHVLTGGVLFRPMVSVNPAAPPDLHESKILLAAGRRDPIVSPGETERLSELLTEAGATVSTHWHNGGHALGRDDIDAAAKWIAAWRASETARRAQSTNT
jgi:phospholipase/carboxylesterase/glyoxalase family protein